MSLDKVTLLILLSFSSLVNGQTTSSVSVGTLGGACFPNGSCSTGYECKDKTCKSSLGTLCYNHFDCASVNGVKVSGSIVEQDSAVCYNKWDNGLLRFLRGMPGLGARCCNNDLPINRYFCQTNCSTTLNPSLTETKTNPLGVCVRMQKGGDLSKGAKDELKCGVSGFWKGTNVVCIGNAGIECKCVDVFGGKSLNGNYCST